MVRYRRRAGPLSASSATPVVRLLVVGDNTGVGTDATQATRSLAGMVGGSHPRLLVHNRSRDGARFDELAAQLLASASDSGYDVILISAGGNDVIRGTGTDALAKALDQTFVAARDRLRPGSRCCNQRHSCVSSRWWRWQAEVGAMWANKAWV